MLTTLSLNYNVDYIIPAWVFRRGGGFEIRAPTQFGGAAGSSVDRSAIRARIGCYVEI
jgi:hypothetical protein